ncbi:MAG: flagellar motor protein [Terriglobia bacterium]
MDIASLIGLILGLGAVIGGAALEGLHLGSITQPTAAIIVFGGTIGAVALGFPLKSLIAAGKGGLRVIFEPKVKNSQIVEEIIQYAHKARKDGLISLESLIPNASDEFLQKAMSLAVDGTDPKVLRETMEIELNHIDEEGEIDAKIFEAAGGYAPTIGIIGAVLGLIHVMENLSDPSKLGSGIAVAFVATVYGVSSANLIYLPFATKLKIRHKQFMVAREMMLEGIIAILEGVNPRIIEEKLKGYLPHEEKKLLNEKSGGKERMAA